MHGTAILAQVPDAVAGEWERFSSTVTEIHALSGTSLPEIRMPRLDRICTALGDDDLDWDALSDIRARRESGDRWLPYMTAWGRCERR